MKKYIGIIIFAILIGVSFFAIYQKLNPLELSKNLIAGSGNIDGDLTLLNTKYSARVEKIFVKEGDIVTKGADIAKLKSDEFLAKKEQLTHSIVSAQKLADAYEKTIKAQSIDVVLLSKTLPELVTIKQSSLNLIKNSLSVITINIKELNLSVIQSKKDYLRNKKLYNVKAISEEKFEIIELKYNSLVKKLQALKIEKEKLLNSKNIAQIDLNIANENLSKIKSAKQNLLSSKDKLLSMKAQVQSLKSQKKEIQAMINELHLYSPIDGFVIEKVVNEGEVVGAGGIVVTLSNTSSYYLKLYVDTLENGKIKIGNNAMIFVDAYPDMPISAKVVSISQKAEFTPKEVSVRSDRIQRVYAVHLRANKYNPILKLGIPAIGVISINGESLPTSLSKIPKI